MKVYNNSLASALQSIYPEHLWFPWKIGRVSVGYWDDINHQKLFMEWLRKELHVRELDQWYRVSITQIEKLAPVTPFEKFGFLTVLKNCYPHHTWDKLRVEK